MDTEMLLRIEAPHFCAGIVTRGPPHQVVLAAPIVRYMLGWNPERVVQYSLGKGWDCHLVTIKPFQQK